jgi:hypothetical protein
LFYEIAIFSGVACSFGGLWCLTLAWLRPRQTVPWLLAGSLCVGLAAGSRPTLIPGGVLAVGGAALWITWKERSSISARRAITLAVAAGMPAGLCGAALAWYNWARFGNPLDFGLLHQQGSNGNGFPFTLSQLVNNLRIYYFKPPDAGWFFPFFFPGPKPLGSYQEQVHGQFLFLPWLALAITWALFHRRSEEQAGGLRSIVIFTALWAIAAMLFVAMAWPHANRYMLDFHPLFVALAVLGLFACATDTPRWRRVAQVAVAGSVLLVVFNICTSFHVHGFFKEARPDEYSRLAQAADRLVWPWHRLAGARLGGMEVVVRFPAGRLGALEPLLVAGGGPDLDALIVKYTKPGWARLMFVHLDYGEVEGVDFELKPGRARWVKINLGSLYPPAWHPWYDGQPPGLDRAVNRVTVQIDGEKVLDRDVVCFQASVNQVYLGKRGGFPIGEERFTGMVERVRGLGADLAGWLEDQQGCRTVSLSLVLPDGRLGMEEPLLLTGRRGQEDLVTITYLRKGAVRFSLWHYGWTEPRHSPELAWDNIRPLQLAITLGSLPGAQPQTDIEAVGLRLEADGQRFWIERFATTPVKPVQNYVGCLPWPVGSVRSLFGGKILAEQRLQGGTPPETQARINLLAGRQVELEFELPVAGVTGNLPLLTTGIVGRGDGLFLTSLSPGRIIVGFDHWGSQPLLSAPLEVSAGRHRLRVSFGARISPELTTPGRLRVELDGRQVFDTDRDFFPAEPKLVFFGANPIGMSTSPPAWTGVLRVLVEDQNEPGDDSGPVKTSP